MGRAGFEGSNSIFEDEEDVTTVQDSSTRSTSAKPIIDSSQTSDNEMNISSTIQSPMANNENISNDKSDKFHLNTDKSVDTKKLDKPAIPYVPKNYSREGIVRDDEGVVPELGNDEGDVLWIDSTYKAIDAGFNISNLEECQAWQQYWQDNSTHIQFKFVSGNMTESEDESEEIDGSTLKLSLVEYELVKTKKRLRELNVSTDLFGDHDAIGLLYKEMCGEHERHLIYKTPEDAKKLGIDEKSPICDPFKEELQPNAETLSKLAVQLNKIVEDFNKSGSIFELKNEVAIAKSADDANPTQALINNIDEQAVAVSKKKRLRRQFETSAAVATNEEEKDDPPSEAPEKGTEEEDADWLEMLEFSRQILEKLDAGANETLTIEKTWMLIDATDETNPVMHILYPQTADGLGLHIPTHSYQRYEKVMLYLPGICADYVPTAIDAFNASDFEAGVNLTELAEKLRNDTDVDEILMRTNGTSRALGGSYILPVLNKNQYDPFSAPIVFQGSAVVVRFGIYIESMSNFQTSTMDYDMDIYLLLAWRDARLVNPYDKPILVKEEEILEKIWRPDPFFDAKEAEFHEVTFLNFLMRIFNDGLVLYETRIKLKPACNLILCKYPHDKQTCELQIKSFAYPIETVRFEWFTRKEDAIDKNPDVKLPELYIDKYEPTQCNRSRKSGDFSCLRAVFRLKRDVGFHIAQTYIPTSLALMFSWVGVWLPEEFMEGRIGVAITVLLTLSTESAGAREHLPSVSYLKAIDLWFGYITGFVFFTLLQTLFVIGFDKRANQLRKWATKKRSDVTQEARDSMTNKANRYHKTGRYLDNFCRVFYPLSFLLFLIMYYFVFTEGRQDDCISTR
ncbi:neurotransmitter-gated ion-channel ligand binding domain-containing protein [Ditylenchus destructor]|uniref:Neurotransmitter-gated ion-channel ligand binding domain-containing protein n=1 Tax=Ditylenchus destructor TaxID=166010 RepID=A0AAD4NGW5_9BILA|nr:neurotransmitter-gated ion-channel ligand binding domain-containing protein [Ditylenchus destructor]